MLISAAVIGSKSFASKLTSHSSHLACMRAAQKAVHTNPQQPENWALLSAAALTYSLCSDCTSFGTLAISTSRLALQKGNCSFSAILYNVVTISQLDVSFLLSKYSLHVHPYFKGKKGLRNSKSLLLRFPDFGNFIYTAFVWTCFVYLSHGSLKNLLFSAFSFCLGLMEVFFYKLHVERPDGEVMFLAVVFLCLT